MQKGFAETISFRTKFLFPSRKNPLNILLDPSLARGSSKTRSLHRPLNSWRITHHDAGAAKGPRRAPRAPPVTSHLRCRWTVDPHAVRPRAHAEWEALCGVDDEFTVLRGETKRWRRQSLQVKYNLSCLSDVTSKSRRCTWDSYIFTYYSFADILIKLHYKSNEFWLDLHPCNDVLIKKTQFRIIHCHFLPLRIRSNKWTVEMLTDAWRTLFFCVLSRWTEDGLDSALTHDPP